MEVFWPGGVRNRLYAVAHGEHVTIPEIPCSFGAHWTSKNAYKACVNMALGQLQSSGTINGAYRNRLLNSAMLAYDDEH